MAIRPPGSSSLQRAPHSAEASGFPPWRAESSRSSSLAVSRTQPAGAAASITTTGFYLVQGGREGGTERRRREGLGWSREENWKMEKSIELVVDKRRAGTRERPLCCLIPEQYIYIMQLFFLFHKKKSITAASAFKYASGYLNTAKKMTKLKC